jgi:hypothetical protein
MIHTRQRLLGQALIGELSHHHPAVSQQKLIYRAFGLEHCCSLLNWTLFFRHES